LTPLATRGAVRVHYGVKAGSGLRETLAAWEAVEPTIDAALAGLVIVDSFDRPAGASLDIGRLLAKEAVVVELIPLHQPLWRTLVGVGEDRSLPRKVGARGVEWRSLGLESLEHWRCQSPRDLAVTVGSFAGVLGEARRLA
jgi:hypothetical protein